MTPRHPPGPVAPAATAGGAASPGVSAWAARATVLAVVLLVGVPLGGPVEAHEADDGVRYRVEEVVPEVDGLSVQVVRGSGPQLVLANDTGEVVEVLDDFGAPFLRIGPQGVEVDRASPTWRATDRPYELGGGDPSEPSPSPAWAPVSSSASWGWFDHRLHEEDVVVPDDAVYPTELTTWEVPLRVGDREVAVRGRVLGGPPSGAVVPRLVTGRTPADGVSVDLLPGGISGLLVRVDAGHTATVRGISGEPFLRFTGEGVDVNQASPTWHRVGGAAPEDTPVDAEADPIWGRVSSSPSFGWIDPRATSPELLDPPEEVADLGTWTVPLEVDGQDVPVVGGLTWQPFAHGTGSGGGLPGWLPWALAGGGAVAIGAVVWRRRPAGGTTS